ncbi:MAG: thiamine pyrophosphate-binding protein [Clostridia bacterium]|nr:thiamine pyrophosphate-binding protein [Clostridia bacterium]
MGKINGGYLAAKALKQEGVEVVFTLVGGHITQLLYGCRDEGIKVVDCRHECAAAYAADAYARATGKPGVVITTAGPGITDTVTAMIEAKMLGSPVIHIGGAGMQPFVDTGALQCINSLEVMSTCTKWSRRVGAGNRTAEYISMAFRYALADTPGPVYLEMPADVLAVPFDDDVETLPRKKKPLDLPAKYRTDAVPFGDPVLIDAVADALAKAKKPAFFIGDHARWNAQYGECFTKLAEHLQAPVMVCNLARGVFIDDHHPLASIGGRCLCEADVIVEIGMNNNYLVRRGWAPFFNADATLVQIDTDKNFIGFNTRADIGIVAGAGAAMKQIYEALLKKMPEPVKDGGWTARAKELNKEYDDKVNAAANSDAIPINPGRCAMEVVKFLESDKGKDFSIICDGGEASLWSGLFAKASRPSQVVTFGPLGTIGTGAGFSLGTYYGTGKPIIYYSGDGSFGFYPMEFDTFAKNNVPLVAVISNDSAWGVIKLSEEYGNKDYVAKNGTVACELEMNRRYDMLPAMWGGVGVLVEKPEDIIPAIEKVIASGKPGIVNVVVDRVTLSPMTAGGSLSTLM